jgi:3D-(3,5/4)-trihydroxycyclohexane-1,2-dione acylhydrolase (decyclizing)
LIIAGGGVIYSEASDELEQLAELVGVPVAETFGGKGAVQHHAWWQLGGIGLEGTPATNTLAAEADLILSVGTRLTDFATGSHSLFANPEVRFASINVNPRDADRLGATGVIGDAKRALVALAEEMRTRIVTSAPEWKTRAEELQEAWDIERAAALDPDTVFDKSTVDPDSDVVTTTDAILTQGQIIGVLQEHSRAGDVIIAAAGGPPGDLQKVWDATDGRTCHLEFGFSCMGYEIPAGIGVRLAHEDPDARVTVFIGDGTFLMAPTELLTAAQEGLAVTVVIPENHGYQVIHRLQMFRHGQEFGNEFRYRTDSLQLTADPAPGKAPRFGGEYIQVDLGQIAEGLGAKTFRTTTAAELRAALDETRGYQGTVVIVAPAIPHADLPAAGVWWDVAPAEIAETASTVPLRAEYEEALSGQRWYG